MVLEKMTIDIPLFSGLETRDDPKLLPPTKLLDLQNATFGKGNATQKRYGQTNFLQSTLIGGSVTAAKKIAARRDELVLHTGSALFTRLEAVDRWTACGTGSGNSIMRLFDLGVDYPVNEVKSQTCADCGTANNITVYAWENELAAANRIVYCAVVDSLSGAVIQRATLGSNLKAPRVLVIGSVILVLVHDTSANDLKVRRIDTSSASALNTSLSSSLIALGYSDIHDSGDPYAYSNGTYAVFCARTTGGGTPIRVGVLLSTGVVATNSDGYGTAATGPGQVPTGNDLLPISFHLNDSNVGLLAWNDNNAIKTCAVTNIVTGAGAITFGTTRTVESAITGQRVACLASATTDNGHVWYTCESGGVGRTNYAFTTAGVLSSQEVRHRVQLASQAVYALGGISGPSVHLYYTTPKTFVLCDTELLPHAKVHAGVAYSFLGATGATLRSCLPSLSSSLHWAAIYQRRLTDDGNEDFSPTAVYTEPSLSRVRYSTSTNLVSTTDARGVLLLGSGLTWQYDGSRVTEVGFLCPPVKLTAVPSNGAGTLTVSSVYTYAAYWEWFDALGNREFSTSLGAFTVTTGATDDTVTITFEALPLTHKQVVTLGTAAGGTHPVLALYRTEANGTVRYRVSSQNPSAAGGAYLANDPTASLLTFVDTFPDSSITSNEIDPYNPSSAGLLPIDAVPPPGLRALHQTQDRVWGVSRENTRRVYYTKLPQPETSVEWSDSLYIDFPEDITGIADVLGRPVFFSADHIYVVDGEGPDNLGTGTYSRVEQLPADVGLYQPETLVETPHGWMFLSRKGFRLLTQGLQVPPNFGNEVNAYIGQAFTGATLISDANCVRFLTSSGSTLHYDYERGQWSRFTAYTGVSSCIWKGTYCIVTSGATVRQETPGLYTQGVGGANIAQVWETSWIRLDRLQGFWRAQWMAILGNWKSTHTCTVEVAYDDVDTYVETFTITPTAGTVAGTASYQNRHRLGRQKCVSIKFRITEVPGTGAGLELNALALRVATKGGINRLGDRTI
jgi:hypothetical protein